MYIRREKGPVYVVLPDGSKLTRSDLPPVNTKRWVARRKATVVAAVDFGLLEASEACNMYHLSDEELDLWRTAVRRHGASALRVTAIQKYRQL
ncbi:DUF1153 domain-containing protein [Amaricoccus sp.]|uniref:CtrA inhibitor SciP n=1 Tax=Amaricoccus sp. TaxID=1872485 RepID=UPI0026368FD6|nr:DUF1153 domain-containing protein [Amaricoccus sp.]HRO12119.1 DUF1153 domain-containing protein [Amaricoccus sp.]